LEPVLCLLLRGGTLDASFFEYREIIRPA